MVATSKQIDRPPAVAPGAGCRGPVGSAPPPLRGSALEGALSAPPRRPHAPCHCDCGPGLSGPRPHGQRRRPCHPRRAPRRHRWGGHRFDAATRPHSGGLSVLLGPSGRPLLLASGRCEAPLPLDPGAPCSSSPRGPCLTASGEWRECGVGRSGSMEGERGGRGRERV
jgi:hypothetical protein